MDEISTDLESYYTQFLTDLYSIEIINKLVEYLESGVAICVAPGLVWDVIDESKGGIRNLEILTDGEWAWPSDLAYYIREYHVTLSEDFMEHVKRNEWTIANKDTC